MRTEIRLSTAEQTASNLWFWRVWDQGRLVARGQSPTEEDAQQAVREVVGNTQQRAVQRAPYSRHYSR